MQAFLLILSLAIIVEALVQYAKTVIKMLENKQYKTFGTQLAAILIAVFICFAAGADIFALMGISFSVHWLGTLLTGIVISIKRLQNPDIGEIVLEDIVEAADPANKAAVHISGVPPNA